MCMCLPSGWIHAVYTPKDSLVFGGNFLNCFNISQQLQVAMLENKLKVREILACAVHTCSSHWFACCQVVVLKYRHPWVPHDTAFFSPLLVRWSQSFVSHSIPTFTGISCTSVIGFSMLWGSPMARTGQKSKLKQKMTHLTHLSAPGWRLWVSKSWLWKTVRISDTATIKRNEGEHLKTTNMLILYLILERRSVVSLTCQRLREKVCCCWLDRWRVGQCLAVISQLVFTTLSSCWRGWSTNWPVQSWPVSAVERVMVYPSSAILWPSKYLLSNLALLHLLLLFLTWMRTILCLRKIMAKIRISASNRF